MEFTKQAIARITDKEIWSKLVEQLPEDIKTNINYNNKFIFFSQPSTKNSSEQISVHPELNF